MRVRCRPESKLFLNRFRSFLANVGQPEVATGEYGGEVG